MTTTTAPDYLRLAIERLQAPNPYGASLPVTHWDVCGPAMMSPDESATPMYDYTRQAWTTADHVHIAPALADGAPIYCGADAITCLGADAAAEL